MYCPKCGKELDEGDICPRCADMEKKKQNFLKHRERVIKKLSMEDIRKSDFEKEVISEERLFNEEKDSKKLDQKLVSSMEDTQVFDVKGLDDVLLDELSSKNDSFNDNSYDGSYDDGYEEDLYEEDAFQEAQFETDVDLLTNEGMMYLHDDYDASINDVSAKRLHKQTKKLRRKNTLIIGASAVLIAIAVIAIVGFCFLQWYHNRKVNTFKVQCETYYIAMRENDVDYGEFREVYDLAKDALMQKNYEAFYDLSARMKDMQDKMTDVLGNLQSLEDVKFQYEKIFEKYVITEEYRAIYDDLMNRLNNAIDNREESVVKDLKKEFESLSINLNTADQQLVQMKLNDITKMDLAKASEAEKKIFSDYERQKNDALDAGNYAEAVRILDIWLSSAKEVEDEIRESESKEKELHEKESREQEDLKKQESETETQNVENKQNNDASTSLSTGSDSR